MAKIIWTKLALADLDSIYDFIAKESPFYAQKTIEQFLSRVEMLSEFPEIGRQVPEYMKKEIREIIEGNYRLFYKVGKKGVYIIRVHHSARRIKGRKNN
jgi:addiction module RelE/StbE family toxin